MELEMAPPTYDEAVENGAHAKDIGDEMEVGININRGEGAAYIVAPEMGRARVGPMELVNYGWSAPINDRHFRKARAYARFQFMFMCFQIFCAWWSWVALKDIGKYQSLIDGWDSDDSRKSMLAFAIWGLWSLALAVALPMTVVDQRPCSENQPPIVMQMSMFQFMLPYFFWWNSDRSKERFPAITAGMVRPHLAGVGLTTIIFVPNAVIAALVIAAVVWAKASTDNQDSDMVAIWVTTISSALWILRYGYSFGFFDNQSVDNFQLHILHALSKSNGDTEQFRRQLRAVPGTIFHEWDEIVHGTNCEGLKADLNNLLCTDAKRRELGVSDMMISAMVIMQEELEKAGCAVEYVNKSALEAYLPPLQ